MLNKWEKKKKENKKIQIPENHSCREHPPNPGNWEKKNQKWKEKKIKKLKTVYKDIAEQKCNCTHDVFIVSTNFHQTSE